MNGENKIIIERRLLKILRVDFMNTNDRDFLNTWFALDSKFFAVWLLWKKRGACLL